MSDKNKFQTGNILLISLTHFVHDVYSSFLAPLLPLLIEKFSLSYTLAGFLTIAQRAPSLFNPLIGLLADRISVKYFVILAPAITVIVMSLLGVAPAYIFLIIILFIMGISASAFHVPAPVMIKHIAGNRLGKAMSFFMLGGELARSIGPIVVLGAVSTWGLDGTYKLIPFGLAASAILFYRFRNFKVTEHIKQNDSSKVWEAFKSLLPLFKNIFGVTLFTSIVKGVITTFLTVYLTQKGESLWYAGISLSVFQFAGAAGTYFAGTLSDTLGRRNVILIASIVNPILLIIFTFSSDVLSFITLIFLGFFLFAFTPVLLAIVNDSKTEYPTFINGIFMTITFLTGAITVAIIGLGADYISLHDTYLYSGFLGFGAIPFVLKFSNSDK